MVGYCFRTYVTGVGGAAQIGRIHNTTAHYVTFMSTFPFLPHCVWGPLCIQHSSVLVSLFLYLSSSLAWPHSVQQGVATQDTSAAVQATHHVHLRFKKTNYPLHHIESLGVRLPRNTHAFSIYSQCDYCY